MGPPLDHQGDAAAARVAGALEIAAGSGHGDVGATEEHVERREPLVARMVAQQGFEPGLGGRSAIRDAP